MLVAREVRGMPAASERQQLAPVQVRAAAPPYEQQDHVASRSVAVAHAVAVTTRKLTEAASCTVIVMMFCVGCGLLLPELAHIDVAARHVADGLPSC